MQTAITWFEIPVQDMARATRFYNTVLAIELEPMEAMDTKNAFFPFHNGVGGSLTQAEGYVPNAHGPVIYLNAGEDLAPALARVEAAGGNVALPKTSIGENGFIAFLIDTEGNRIGLHSTH
jgi:predicted enzyme related to lactoylglutathione lyase